MPVMGGGGEVLLKVPSGREVGGPLNKKTMHLRRALWFANVLSHLTFSGPASGVGKATVLFLLAYMEQLKQRSRKSSSRFIRDSARIRANVF